MDRRVDFPEPFLPTMPTCQENHRWRIIFTIIFCAHTRFYFLFPFQLSKEVNEATHVAKSLCLTCWVPQKGLGKPALARLACCHHQGHQHFPPKCIFWWLKPSALSVNLLETCLVYCLDGNEEQAGGIEEKGSYVHNDFTSWQWLRRATRKLEGMAMPKASRTSPRGIEFWVIYGQD